MNLKFIEASLNILIVDLHQVIDILPPSANIDLGDTQEILYDLLNAIKRLKVVFPQDDGQSGIYNKTRYPRDKEPWLDAEITYLSDDIIREYSVETEYLFYFDCSRYLARSVENVKAQTQAIIEDWRVQFEQDYEVKIIDDCPFLNDQSETSNETCTEEDEDYDDYDDEDE